MLRDLNLLPVYDSAEHDLVADLIVPLLQNSNKYLRGVGFFTSGWLRMAARGLVDLIETGGIAQFVVSPILAEGDWEALQLGDIARRDQELKRVLERSMHNLELSLEDNTKNCLAWLVADEILDFKFAIPREISTGGNYHDKVGIFIDKNNNIVAIHGSFNDTYQGTLNGEAFSVFKGWEAGHIPFVKMHKERLERLWENGNNQFVVRPIPEAVRERLVHLRKTTERPYTFSKKQEVVHLFPETPQISRSLRDYQIEAIRKWKQDNHQGVFEMATGTGKTVTALAAAVEEFNESGQVALLIFVPYLHLLEQWAQNCREFGFIPLLCSGAHPNWYAKAKSLLADFRFGALAHVSLIAVHDTAASERFQEVATLLVAEKTMVIYDEVHALGAPTLRAALIPNAKKRLGLSATPRRWYDEEGTKVLFDYFGGVSYEFSLEAAIGKFLVPYEYHPILIQMTKHEEEQYVELSAKIAMICARKERDPNASDVLKKLCIERSRAIGTASAKMPALMSTLRHMVQDCEISHQRPRDILIYCAPGRHREVLQEVARLGLNCHEFVHATSIRDREKVLERFSNGSIEVLVAIKCLDEGVDVPSTKTAFFLASTSNPREFVQRRGRVLRLADGKDRAILYDFIVIPSDGATIETAKSVLQREMPRFAEFACVATNEFEARSQIRPILDKYGLLHLLDERPWDIYHRFLASGSNFDFET